MAFLRTYVIRLGFLDGQHGLMLAIYNAEYTYYKYIKLMFLDSPADSGRSSPDERKSRGSGLGARSGSASAPLRPTSAPAAAG